MSSEEEVQKKKENRKNRSEGYKKLWVLVVVVGVISIIMLFFYFLRFNNGLSYDSNNWAAFGSYFGSVTGLLAFAGVLYSSHLSEKRAEEAEAKLEQLEEESRKRYVEDSERAIFFQLLDLHNKKSKSITFNGINHIVTIQNSEGNDAFKYYLKLVNYYTVFHLIANDILKYQSEEELFSAYNSNIIREYNELFGMRNYLDNKKIIKLNLEIKQVSNSHWFNPQDSNIYYCLSWARLKRNIIMSNEMFESIKFAFDVIYRDFGYIIDQYFRNLYNILDTIDNFRGDKTYKYKYVNLIKVQLSRYELALIIGNSVSSQSNERIVDLLLKYDIINEFNNQDLFFTEAIPNNSINNSEKDAGKIIVDEILAEAKKQFSNGK